MLIDSVYRKGTNYEDSDEQNSDEENSNEGN